MSALQPLYCGTRGFGLAMAVVGWAALLQEERDLYVRAWERQHQRPASFEPLPVPAHVRYPWPTPVQREYARWYQMFVWPDAWLVPPELVTPELLALVK